MTGIIRTSIFNRLAKSGTTDLLIVLEQYPMNTPVVLITCALTSFGRATALAFAREGARASSSLGGATRLAKSWRLNSALWERRPNICLPMYATKMMKEISKLLEIRVHSLETS